MGKVNVNFKRVVNENKKFQKEAERSAKNKYLENKEIFLKNFDDHPVTQEIADGATASNQSQTLNGIGNLFSFIGFYSSDNPIGDLRVALEKNFLFKRKNSKDKIQFMINYPSLEKIKPQTPMPWENGRSWVVGIEKGISGFSSYMYKKFVQGRSQEGLQSQNKVRGNSFRPTKYMTELIGDFIKGMKS